MNFNPLMHLDRLQYRLDNDPQFTAVTRAALGGALLMSGISPMLPSWARLVLAVLALAALLWVLQPRNTR